MEYGCIGERLGHSFSKEIHNALTDYKYELKELSKDEVTPFMNERDFKAINVTIPYKETVIPFLDFISDEAKKIGAVNTIVNKDGKLYGYNTDFFGMKSLIKYADIEIKNKVVAILGGGGTSKTAFAVSVIFQVTAIPISIGLPRQSLIFCFALLRVITLREIFLLGISTSLGLSPFVFTSPLWLSFVFAAGLMAEQNGFTK